MDISQMLKNPSLNQAIFYPRSSKKPTSSTNKKVLEFSVERAKIGGIFHIKDKKKPTMLLFHGNGEIAQDYDSIASRFTNYGVNMAVVDYRGYGFGTGTPTYYDLLNDSMEIYFQLLEWMEERQYTREILILGRSLGSAATAQIGGNNPKEVKGYIFESGFARTFKLMEHLFSIQFPKLNPNIVKKWSNEFRVKKIKKPILVIHGTSDGIIPFEQGKSIYECAEASPSKRFVKIEGAGHNTIMMHEKKYFGAIEEFFREVLQSEN